MSATFRRARKRVGSHRPDLEWSKSLHGPATDPHERQGFREAYDEHISSAWHPIEEVSVATYIALSAGPCCCDFYSGLKAAAGLQHIPALTNRQHQSFMICCHDGEGVASRPVKDR
jgi:hypothetical protein